MKRQHSAEDIILDAVALEGARRCINRRRSGSSALIPDDPFLGELEEIAQRQKETFSPEDLTTYQTLLLKRAKMWLEFWDANVGGSVEFPVVMAGENGETLDLMESLLTELRMAVGVLSEV